MKENIKFYKVVCKCGHVGRNFYIPIAFAIKAEDKKEAARIARSLPRVKHHLKDAVLSCEEISEEQYRELLSLNKKDSYLHCKNIQEQREHPEIIERALRMEGQRTYTYKKKEEYSMKYLAWKRNGRYDVYPIEDDEEDDFYLREALLHMEAR